MTPTWIISTRFGRNRHALYLGLCTLVVEWSRGYWRPNLLFGSAFSSNLAADYLHSLFRMPQRRFRNVEKAKRVLVGVLLSILENMITDVRKL